MTTMSHGRTFTALIVGAALAAPSAAFAAPTQERSAAQEAGSPALVKNYELNSVDGSYAPVPTGSAGGTGAVHGAGAPSTAAEDAGFSWGDAAAGAGVALLLAAGLGLVGRTALGQRRSPARIGS